MPDGRPVVSLRAGTPDDRGDLLRLFEEVAAEGLWIGAEAPLRMTPTREAVWDRRLSGDAEAGAMLVAEVAVDEGGGRDLGGWIGLDRQWTRDLQFSMVVAAAHRGAGIGGRLLDGALDWARGTGTPKVTCHVWPHNTPALSLYLSRGFVVEGRLHRHWPRADGQRWDSVLMGLLLDDGIVGSPYPDSPLLAGTPAARSAPGDT